jgi:mono/diheme cytochrome c family protein
MMNKKRWNTAKHLTMKRNHTPGWLIAAGAALLIIASQTSVRPVSSQGIPLMAGQWAGEASFSIGSIRHTAAIQFDVDRSGQVTAGSIVLFFTYPDIQADVLDLMKRHGCIVKFSEITPSSRPTAGLFATPTEGAGTFFAPGCMLEGFGELQFVSPLSGIWTAVAQNPIQAGAEGGNLAVNESPYDPPSHPNDNLSGRDLYKLHCDECHAQKGLGSEKAPPLEELNAIKIASTVRDGPEDMDVFTHEELPDRQLNVLIDYVLKFHPDSALRIEFIITPPTTE